MQTYKREFLKLFKANKEPVMDIARKNPEFPLYTFKTMPIKTRMHNKLLILLDKIITK